MFELIECGSGVSGPTKIEQRTSRTQWHCVGSVHCHLAPIKAAE